MIAYQCFSTILEHLTGRCIWLDGLFSCFSVDSRPLEFVWGNFGSNEPLNRLQHAFPCVSKSIWEGRATSMKLRTSDFSNGNATTPCQRCYFSKCDIMLVL